MKTSSQIKAAPSMERGMWSMHINKGCGEKKKGGQTPGGWNILCIPTNDNGYFYCFILIILILIIFKFNHSSS